MHFLISFLVLVLYQLWILRGRFLCCRFLMKLQGTPYCHGVGDKKKQRQLESSSSQKYLKHSPPKIFRLHCICFRKHAAKHQLCILGKQYHMVALLINIQVVVNTHFFSSSLERTKRVKFLSSMKPIINAMAPPTAEAMMVVSVLSATLTTNITKRDDEIQ